MPIAGARAPRRSSARAVSSQLPAAEPNKPVPRVEDRITFAVHRINARLAQVCNQRFKKYGVDLVSSRLLALLSERQTIRVGELVDLLVLPQSTVSHQLQRLERRRLIKRVRAADDNRSVTVSLTAAGRDVARACNVLSAEVYRAATATFTSVELSRMRDYAARMFDNLADFETDGDDAVSAGRVGDRTRL